MADNGQARILTFHEPDSHTAQYLVIDDSSKKAAVVDSVLQYNVVTGATSTAAIDELLAVVENEGLDVEWVLSTHAHGMFSNPSLPPPPTPSPPHFPHPHFPTQNPINFINQSCFFCRLTRRS